MLLDGGADIRIECAFSLRTPSGEMVVIAPEQLGPGLEHLVCVLHQTVTDAVAQDSGNLVLTFANGAGIEVASDRCYEAWRLAESDGRLAVVSPGGEVVTWGPNA